MVDVQAGGWIIDESGEGKLKNWKKMQYVIIFSFGQTINNFEDKKNNVIFRLLLCCAHVYMVCFFFVRKMT